jgi:Rrf2 family protein
MRMSAKAEYAVRAMVQLATVDDGVLVTTDDLAKAQGIPPQFLVDILTALRNDRLVRSHRGRDGGYALARPAVDISIADVLRCIDGPLASVRDIGLGDLPYSGPTAALTDVWRALRASMIGARGDEPRRGRRRGAARACRQDGRRLQRPGRTARALRLAAPV